MTIAEPHPTTTNHHTSVVDAPTTNNAKQHCKQIVWDTTGERPAWIIYDPTKVAAAAHLSTPTRSIRFLLGVAGYLHDQTIATGEVWVLTNR